MNRVKRHVKKAAKSICWKMMKLKELPNLPKLDESSCYWGCRIYWIGIDQISDQCKGISVINRG